MNRESPDSAYGGDDDWVDDSITAGAEGDGDNGQIDEEEDLFPEPEQEKDEEEVLLNAIRKIIVDAERMELRSYTDYPIRLQFPQ